MHHERAIFSYSGRGKATINSLEPRWFFGCKGFAETAIGAPPGALSNALYNACGVRIREHPITKDKILAGLKAKTARG